jgi:hypothetical protein
VPEHTLSVLDGSTFVAGDRLGDIRADDLQAPATTTERSET